MQRLGYLHNGFVGGWFDTADSLFYFDSSRIFPEDSLAAAKKFGIENGQIAIFIISEGREIRLRWFTDLSLYIIKNLICIFAT